MKEQKDNLLYGVLILIIVLVCWVKAKENYEKTKERIQVQGVSKLIRYKKSDRHC